MLTIRGFLLIILIVIEKKAMYPHPPDRMLLVMIGSKA